MRKQWDPDNEIDIDDDEYDNMMDRWERGPFSLDISRRRRRAQQEDDEDEYND